MTEPTDTELDAVLCKHWPAFSTQATLVRMWVRAAMRDAIAKWDTPPAEQQATKETSGGFHVWRDISTAPKDGSRFVATGHNYGLYSEVRHTCVAQWFQGCWMEASDWNETSELKYLTHWMPLPSPPDDVAAPADQQAEQVIIDFAQVGTAGPFPVVNGRVSLPDATMQDLVRMLRPTYAAEQVAPKAAPQPAPAPLSESEYKRGYRDGYERRDAEVRGALV